MFTEKKIVSIEAVGEEGVWDITVEEDASYVAQGFVNHNSSDPNMQNIPSRVVLLPPYKIKNLFRPPAGYKIVQVDFSQMELRVLASLSGDKNMIQCFKDGVDLHIRTASKIFGVTVDDVSKEMRTSAKAINFGIAYGLSEDSLAIDIYKALEGNIEKARAMLVEMRGE